MSAVGGVEGKQWGVHGEISTDPRWIKFIKTLEEKDYFQVHMLLCHERL